MTAEEKEALAEMNQRNLVKCPHCLTVLGRRDWLGTQVLETIREHEEYCYQAQIANKEKNSLRKIQKEAISKIFTVCHNSNLYKYMEYSFEMEPAPHHMDKPDSEEYKFERDWNERKLTDQSNKLVYAWEDLIKFRDSSKEAKYAVNFYWKQQVSSYEDRYGPKMYRMKSFQIP